MTDRYRSSILIVDDEIEILRALQRGLAAHGYEVISANSGEKALIAIEERTPDLLLLDLGLPDINGLEVCKRVREQSDLPIIVISVKDKERDKVYALDLGADDYISKPFGLDEVLARIRVALRHAARMLPRVEQLVTLGPLRVDLTHHIVEMLGQEIKLTPTEYDLLCVFLKHRGKIVTRQMLLTQVWGSNHDSKSHYLHVYIGQLRRKIEPDPTHPRLLLTISGVGYRFNDEASDTYMPASDMHARIKSRDSWSEHSI